VASFTTIYWTTDSEAVVADIQSRLARLGYLMPARNDSQYVDTQRTLRYVGNSNPDSDGVGYYQNATDAAIRAFEFEYLQHRQGQFPGGGCDSQTYQALIKATG
jgi:peptidoglycan hydrolase-like protein with peptidoglycan-binding domain